MKKIKGMQLGKKYQINSIFCFLPVKKKLSRKEKENKKENTSSRKKDN